MIQAEGNNTSFSGSDILTEYMALTRDMVKALMWQTECSEECARDIMLMALDFAKRRIENGV